MLVEAELLRQVHVAAELPLAGDARHVASGLEQVAEGGELRVHVSEVDVVPDIVLPGHELHARGCAERLHEAVREARARGGQLV
jgi:hypothetical protein